MKYKISDGSEVEINAGDLITVVDGLFDEGFGNTFLVVEAPEGDIIVIDLGEKGKIKLSATYVKPGAKVEQPPASIDESVQAAIDSLLPQAIQKAIEETVNLDELAQKISDIVKEQIKPIVEESTRAILSELFQKASESVK